jgi:Putative peptidoglycan binding domain/OmpA family
VANEDKSSKKNESQSHIEDHPDQSFEVAIAPFFNDEAEPLNTLRPALLSVACWRLDDKFFDFDSSFIVPAAKSELARLGELHDDYADSPMSIFGHADPTGTESYNKTLSGNRARALYGLLVRDLDDWEKLFNEHSWGLRSTQVILAHLDSEQSPPVPQSFAQDGKDSKAWQEAVKVFQRANSLKDDGVAGKNTRNKLYELYMRSLATKPDGTPFEFKREAFLGKGEDPKGKAAFQGCSEFNPILILSETQTKQLDEGQDKHATRNLLNAPNRRVVLYFFPPGLEADLSKWPCPLASEGPSKCRKRFWSDHKTRLKADPDFPRSYGPIPNLDPSMALDPSRDTFACRFYDRLARRSPCEAGFQEWIVQFVFPGNTPLEGRTRVAGVPYEATTSGGTTKGITDVNGTARVRMRSKQETVRIKLTIPLELVDRAQGVDFKVEGEREAAVDVNGKPRPPAPPPGPDEYTVVELELQGGQLTELDDPDPAKKVAAQDDRLFNLGFGLTNPPRDPIAVADEFKKQEKVAAAALVAKLHELYGS